MRTSSIFVPGVFCGADIEPGTFHHLILPDQSGLDSQPENPSKSEATAPVPADAASQPAVDVNDPTRPPACVGPFAEPARGCTIGRVS